MNLPSFLLNKGEHDLLSYNRQDIKGCTQPQMHLKLPGVWTRINKEKFCFMRTVNINHGEGDVDWYCLDDEQIKKCNENASSKQRLDINQIENLLIQKQDFETLIKYGIKFKKVRQHKGDIIILGPDVHHWAMSRGKTVQIQWHFALRTIKDVVNIHKGCSSYEIDHKIPLLSKSLFLDLLNFEYHHLNFDLVKTLVAIMQDNLTTEMVIQQKLSLSEHSNKFFFYDQLPAQLRHLKIYFCGNELCRREIFCYFGLLKSVQVEMSVDSENSGYLIQNVICAKCVIQILEKQVSDKKLFIFRKFDLHSLKYLLSRVNNFLVGKSLPFFPIECLTSVNDFCGQIPNVNDFIFNKSVSNLQTMSIPDQFPHQGFVEMHQFQVSLKQGKNIFAFSEIPIQKFRFPFKKESMNQLKQDLLPLHNKMNYEIPNYSFASMQIQKSDQRMNSSSNQSVDSLVSIKENLIQSKEIEQVPKSEQELGVQDVTQNHIIEEKLEIKQEKSKEESLEGDKGMNHKQYEVQIKNIDYPIEKPKLQDFLKICLEEKEKQITISNTSSELTSTTLPMVSTPKKNIEVDKNNESVSQTKKKRGRPSKQDQKKENESMQIEKETEIQENKIITENNV